MKRNTVLTILFLFIIATVIGTTGCRLLFPWAYPSADKTLENNRENLESIHATGDPANAEAVAFSQAFMQTFAMESNQGIVSWVGGTTLPGGRSRVSAMATVPVDVNSIDFSAGSGTITDYPEPGHDTTYTISAAAGVGSTAYFISSVTTYPDASTMQTYTEEYYIKDQSEGSTTADGVWDEHDPIVDANGVADPLSRIKQEILFRDGSVRYESLVDVDFSALGDLGFAEFDLLDNLTYPDLFYPAGDEYAAYSSVIIYTHVRNTDHDFSFWAGTEQQDILGVRFYTEHYVDGGDTYRGTLVAFEKVISTFVTQNGSFVDQMLDVFIGSEHTTLAESVFRKEVLFDVAAGTINQSAVDSNSVMRSHVVDISATADFQLQLLNDDTLVLLDWEGAPYHIPDGQADEIIAEADVPADLELLVQTVATNPDGSDIPLITSTGGTSELAELYTSINNGAATVSFPADVTDIPNTLDNEGDLLSFAGEQGTTFPDSPELSPITEGTVEAWVYITATPKWAGIVHKGVLSNFDDEAYSLQFWGTRGNVSFAIVEQDPKYKASLAKSGTRLNHNRWYYVVGTWDAAEVKIYIDGVLDNAEPNDIGEPYDSPGALVIGSQLFSDEETLRNYYGFTGAINGVRVTDSARTAAEIQDHYDTYVGQTANWPTE